MCSLRIMRSARRGLLHRTLVVWSLGVAFIVFVLVHVINYIKKDVPQTPTRTENLFEEIKVGLIEIDSDPILKYGESVASWPEMKYVLQSDMCPICFGDGVCKDFKTGSMTISSKSLTSPGKRFGKTVYNGFMGNRDKIVIKTVGADLLKTFYEKICLNVTKVKQCHVRTAFRESFLYQYKEEFKKNVTRLSSVAGRSQGDIP